jgi:hypothetical protein
MFLTEQLKSVNKTNVEADRREIAKNLAEYEKDK